MSAESIDELSKTTETAEAELELSGMLPRTSPDSVVASSEILSTRTRALAATLIKERFQKLPGTLSADERAAKRAQLRQESVRQLFKIVGILPPKDEDVNEEFAGVYSSAEEKVEDMDKNHLVDLLDTYEAHPAMRIIDTVAETSGIAQDDLVFMRRASLLLLEQYSSQQQS